jgi:ABC-type antimicrobial peptide transport system permease subunit
MSLLGARRLGRASAAWWALARDGLRASGTRAAVAVGGVAVGIAPVLLIVGVMTGVRGALARDFGQVAPNSFTVSRSSLSEALTDTVSGRHAITELEVGRLAELPMVRSAAASVDATVALDVGRDRYRDIAVEGTTANWLESHDGEFLAGRNFAADEERRAAQVAVISSALARHIAPSGQAVGETVHLEGEPFRIVGVFRERPSLLADTGSAWIRTPFTTALRVLPAETDWVEVHVAPVAGVSREDAEDAVTAHLRSVRRLRPHQRDDFAIVDEAGIDALFTQYGGTLVVVTLLLTGLALAVAGVGIVGIMTISIAERTVEIGVKRAIGATRRDIAAQFLVETVGITVTGSVVGIVLGVAAIASLRALTTIPADVPGWAVVVTLLTAIVSGIGLGVYPALRAARLEPVEALRRA